MTDSATPQLPHRDPPSTSDDADAWAQWAVEFLDVLSRRWSDWRKTWSRHDVPVYRQGNPDAWLSTDRVTRQVATDHKLVPGSPPREICEAPDLLDVCSHAVQRFGARSAWIFSPAEQADEIAQALLQVADAIKNERYHEVAQAHLERLCQLVKLATRREQHSETAVVEAPRPKPKRGRRPDTDPKEDARIVQAWKNGPYKTHADLAGALKLSKLDVTRAIDRNRKRK